MKLKRSRLETIVFTIIAVVLTLDAIFLMSGQKFSWPLLAQAYEEVGPFPDQGIVQPGVNAIIDSSEDGSIAIISLGADGLSTSGLTLTADDLAALPEAPDEAVVVASTEDNYITLYKLPSGELQANIGPDAEGKIFVYVFEAPPLVCVSRYEFSTSDATPRFRGPC